MHGGAQDFCFTRFAALQPVASSQTRDGICASCINRRILQSLDHQESWGFFLFLTQESHPEPAPWSRGRLTCCSEGPQTHHGAVAGSLAVQKDLRPIMISDCAGLGCWSSASVRHLLTCLPTSCLGFLSLLDEISLGFPPPLLPLQFCMCHLLKPFLSRSVSSPGSETPEGGPGVPRPDVGWHSVRCRPS